MLLLCKVTYFSWGRDLFDAGATRQAGCKEKPVLKYNILKHHALFFLAMRSQTVWQLIPIPAPGNKAGIES